MVDFWKSQMDYVFFLYGLSFIFLGTICFSLKRSGFTDIPWTILGAFGFLHGLCEWLDLCALSISDGYLFSLIRLLLKCASFAVLISFCLRSPPIRSERAESGWLLIVGVTLFVLFASTILPISLAGLDDIGRWLLALPGCLWTASIICKSAIVQDSGKRRNLLYALSASFVCYGLAAGATVPTSPIVPIWAPTHEGFLAAAHVPIQVFRALFAAIAAMVLWAYEVELTASADTAKAMRESFARTLIILIIAGAMGWVLTYWLGVVDTGPSGHRLIGIGSCLVVSLLILAHYLEVKRRINVEIMLRDKKLELEQLIAYLHRQKNQMENTNSN